MLFIIYSHAYSIKWSIPTLGILSGSLDFYATSPDFLTARLDFLFRVRVRVRVRVLAVVRLHIIYIGDNNANHNLKGGLLPLTPFYYH